MAAYATASDLKSRYDARTLGMLVSDTGTAIPEDSLANDTNISTALQDASGWVDSYALRAKRYTASNLSSLTGNSLNLLKRVVCDIAFALLVQRRPYAVPRDQLVSYQSALDMLEQIRLGQRVFAVDAVLEAGTAFQQPKDRTTVLNQNLLRDRSKVFPTRTWRKDQL